MSIRDWALGDGLINPALAHEAAVEETVEYRAGRLQPKPQLVYPNGQPISAPPPAQVLPQAQPAGAQAWSPAQPPPAAYPGQVWNPQHGAVQGAHVPQPPPARWTGMPKPTCVLVRPGPAIYEHMLAHVPDLLPSYEQHHGIEFSREVDGMEMRGRPYEGLNEGGTKAKYGRGGGDLNGYLQHQYGTSLEFIRRNE